jgi:hypothetical protein
VSKANRVLAPMTAWDLLLREDDAIGKGANAQNAVVAGRFGTRVKSTQFGYPRHCA